MKLPRWLVILMLSSSLLAVLAAPGWWWVTSPERDMYEFLSFLNNAQLEELNAMMVNGNAWNRASDGMICFQVQEGYTTGGTLRVWRREVLNAKPQPRLWSDLLKRRIRLRMLPVGSINMGPPSCLELEFEMHRVRNKWVRITEQEFNNWWVRPEKEQTE